jgi:hypothetical protein
MKEKSISQLIRCSRGEGGFFSLRVLVSLFMVLAGISLALLGFGMFSAQGQQNYSITTRSTDPLVPALFDCSKIRELGIDMQENLRAGAIMIFCGEAEGGKPSPAAAFYRFVQNLMPSPLAYGTTDVDLVTGTEISPNITQSETFTAANPDNPLQIVVAYNDSRGRNAAPINISGASASTDGGNTFTRLTGATGQSPFSNTFGDPVIVCNKPSGTWFTVWLDGGCGGQGLGGYKSTTPWDPNSWHITAFTPVPQMTESLVGLIIAQAPPSSEECTSLGTTSHAARVSSSASRLITERHGLTRDRSPIPSSATCRSPVTLPQVTCMSPRWMRWAGLGEPGEPYV